MSSDSLPPHTRMAQVSERLSDLPCIGLSGPTACGKSACALAVAQSLSSEYPIEIISVDSALVYRGMDIGTAKPSLAERAKVPHHLIDIMEPSQAYSAAKFVLDAKRLIAQIRARQHWPLLVGGTLLYFKALFEGLDAMPGADPVIRADLAQQLAQEGLGALYAQLQQIDPLTAARLAPGDTQRILRAIEVFRITGQPLSDLHSKKDTPEHSAQPLLISLEPQDRSWLNQRIEQRFEQMLADGLLAEVTALMQRGDLHAELPSMRCVGYRQAWEGLQRGDTSRVAEQGSAASRQLAKRQLTWLRSLPQRHTVFCDLPDAVEQVIGLARQGLASLQG
jgi:tRNA dimethylallyltransferase